MGAGCVKEQGRRKYFDMKTKSAVKWLFEQIQNGNITSEKTDCGYFVMINDDCLNKALEMEDKRNLLYYEIGYKNGVGDSVLSNMIIKKNK